MEKNEAAKLVADKLDLIQNEADMIIDKAEKGGEFSDAQDLKTWVDKRFLPNCVSIDETGYSMMCIDALKILSRTAPTDYGSSRQRDLGQLWADMTRGYLGEYAFQLFLNNRWNINVKLGHEVGKLEDYLPTDIHMVKEPSSEYRPPKIKVSLKTTKWNGIWLDIPGDQFDHSDVHVLIKVGAGRDHLFAFFKKISVFKDKVLKRGQEVGSISQTESEEMFNKLPTFKPIPAYICGFIKKNQKYSDLSYEGKKGRKNYTITRWNGPIKPGDLDKIKQKEGVTGSVSFEGIGDFAHDNGYLFNTGNLLWSDKDWQEICKQL